MANKDTIQGNWEQIKGKLKQQWGKLTDDDILRMKGSYQELAGKLQSYYGYKEEETKQEIDKFLDKYHFTDKEKY